jgi:WD40 repeat protein
VTSSPVLAVNNAGVVLALADEGVAVWQPRRPHLTLWFRGAAFAAASHDGRKLAIQYGSGRVEIRSAAQPTKTLASFRTTLGLVDFSPDGSEFVARGLNAVGVWSATTLRQLDVFRNHASWFERAVASPRGKFLLTEDLEASLRLWRTSPSRCSQACTPDPKAPKTTATSPASPPTGAA